MKETDKVWCGRVKPATSSEHRVGFGQRDSISYRYKRKWRSGQEIQQNIGEKKEEVGWEKEGFEELIRIEFQREGRGSLSLMNLFREL